MSERMTSRNGRLRESQSLAGLVGIAGTKRTYQIRLGDVGVALYDGVDGADALRQFWVNRSRGETGGAFVLDDGNSAEYASGTMDGYVVEAVDIEA